MKNQVGPVCSPKDKIWLQTDKLQRCRRLPLEQAKAAKLRQILENKSEDGLFRKWFDRLRGKINHVLNSQQLEPGASNPYFPYEMQQFPLYSPRRIYPGFPSPNILNDRSYLTIVVIAKNQSSILTKIKK